MRSPASPEITQPNVSPVIHGTFYKKLVTSSPDVRMRSLESPAVTMKSQGSSQFTRRHLRSHNRMYYRWYMVLSIRNYSPEVNRFSCGHNEVTRITWDHTTEWITGDTWYFL